MSVSDECNRDTGQGKTRTDDFRVLPNPTFDLRYTCIADAYASTNVLWWLTLFWMRRGIVFGDFIVREYQEIPALFVSVLFGNGAADSVKKVWCSFMLRSDADSERQGLTV